MKSSDRWYEFFLQEEDTAGINGTKWIEENDPKSHPANIGAWFRGVHLTVGRKPIWKNIHGWKM
jgi:hypothetical protein